MNDAAILRFWNCVDKKDAFGCWNWKASLQKSGYGNFWDGEKVTYAHRASYLINKGNIPKGFCVIHSCDNPSCVNPNHLSAGTQSENMQDCSKKKRLNPNSWRKSGQNLVTRTELACETCAKTFIARTSEIRRFCSIECWYGRTSKW